MRLAVAIATTGRAAVLRQTAPTMLAQTRAPDVFLISGAAPEDVAGLAELDPRIETMIAPRGASAQRNAAMNALRGRCDAVVFFDDDYVPTPTYLAEIERLFTAHPDVAALTGWVFIDGVHTGGVSFEEAAVAIQNPPPPAPRPDGAEMWDIDHVYGCNMAARMPAAADVGFDERLPLYSWQEDRDFSRRLAAHGRIARSYRLLGVHLGVTKARSPGLRLGYSQVANPLYLLRKGTMKPFETFDLVGRNIAANAVRSFKPEPWIDRVGRLRGNLLALADAMRGRVAPERILQFK
ncbi:MAG: glycosyltransferase [Hyphomonadaceae bacterium]|nr:glycosyltransferase [Hyphomonadaceae bacterium]